MPLQKQTQSLTGNIVFSENSCLKIWEYYEVTRRVLRTALPLAQSSVSISPPTVKTSDFVITNTSVRS